MKSKDDGSRGPCGPDGSVTPRYITKKSPRNVRHGVLETSLAISRVFSKIEVFDYTRSPRTERIENAHRSTLSRDFREQRPSALLSARSSFWKLRRAAGIQPQLC